MPASGSVSRNEVRNLLMRLVEDVDREMVKARIRSAGTPLYMAAADHPGTIVEIQADGTRTSGHLEGRRFVPAEQDRA